MNLAKQFITVIIVFSLFLSGCASHNRQPRVNGQSKEELRYVYDQKIKAVQLRKESIERYFSLEKKCMKYTRSNRIAAANACNTKLKSLGSNIEYFEEVIKNKNEIIDDLDAQERELQEQRDREFAEASKSTWGTIKTIISVALVVGLLSYAANIDTDGQDAR